MKSMRQTLLAATLALVLGCDQGVGVDPALSGSQIKQCSEVVGERICVTGAVNYYNLEGGFWAVRGDDKVTYDPVGGLPEGFEVDGLRVFLVAKELKNAAGVHMVGPIVDIISITRQ